MTKTNVNYTIIDKQGKVLQDETFNDYDKLADHMLDLAEKWYSGQYDEGDQLKISTYDEAGNLVYSDTATFGETANAKLDLSESPDSPSWQSGKGFGASIN